jgi:hypothetical protein
MKRLMGVFCILILLPALVPAQSLKIEALRPQFKFGEEEPTLLTSAWFVTVAVPIYKRINFVGQLPFAFGKLKETIASTDETFGNPALGLRFDHKRLTIDVAVRIPIVKTGFAGFIGALADLERQEAFIPDILPVVGMIRTNIDAAKFSVSPYGGVSLNYKFEHKEGEKFDFFRRIYKVRANDGELYFLYGVEGWYKLGLFHLGATYNARTWVTSGGTFSQSSLNQLGLQANLTFAKVKPGVLFRYPLDNTLLDYLIGIQCAFTL